MRRASFGKSTTVLIWFQNIVLEQAGRLSAAENAGLFAAKPRSMKSKFASRLKTISSDGRIINAFIVDNDKKIYEYPNKASDVTNCPERAYYSREMLALRPLSDIDEAEEIFTEPWRKEMSG